MKPDVVSISLAIIVVAGLWFLDPRSWPHVFHEQLMTEGPALWERTVRFLQTGH
jgi:hypothetical protein